MSPAIWVRLLAACVDGSRAIGRLQTGDERLNNQARHLRRPYFCYLEAGLHVVAFRVRRDYLLVSRERMPGMRWSGTRRACSRVVKTAHK
jgi:hypothetical protein